MSKLNSLANQLTLNLSAKPVMHLSSFAEPAAGRVVKTVTAFIAQSGEAVLYLAGPPATGKTHLLLGALSAFEAQQQTDEQLSTGFYLPCGEILLTDPALLDGLEQHPLLCIDDMHLVAGKPEWELAFFHLFNRCKDRGHRWLVAGDHAPQHLPLTLPDLKSRLAWGEVIYLPQLGEEQRVEVLEKQAHQYGFTLSPEVAQYIIRRAPRDLEALSGILQTLDKASLQEKRVITVPFVKSVMGW